jgi:hypothetical protein
LSWFESDLKLGHSGLKMSRAPREKSSLFLKNNQLKKEQAQRSVASGTTESVKKIKIDFFE